MTLKKNWELINSTIKNKPNSKSHCEFVLDGRTITNSGEIATAFNEYFVNIGRKLYPVKYTLFINIVII